MQRILIVDDDPSQRRLLEHVVGRLGYAAETANHGRAAVDRLLGPGAEPVDLVLLDLMMPELDGIGVLQALRPALPNLPVIVLTAHGGIDGAVRALKAGATDFLVKPVPRERLEVSIQNALQLNALSGEVRRLKHHLQSATVGDGLVAESAAMRRVVAMAQRASQSHIPILLQGESGVGKEVVARIIQANSDRVGRPFVTVNCAAIPDNLVESLLFGHEKGSFTGAERRHLGKFQEANGGTLFLDEIGELSMPVQSKLLRALQEGEVEPVGGATAVKVDIRLISATNRDLQQGVARGSFREDLYYRLNAFPIHVPPLRQRPEDIPALAEKFMREFAAAEGKTVETIEPEALAWLKAQPWPGNVRQLRNTIFRAVVMTSAARLSVADLPQVGTAQTTAIDGAGPIPPPSAAPARAVPAFDPQGDLRSLTEIEGDVIRLALEHYQGHMSRVAKHLGIGRSTLYRKVREHGIPHQD